MGKKLLVIALGTVFLVSCTPKRPANTTTANTQAVITTTAGLIKTQPLNTSNTSNASSNTNKTVTIKSTNAGENKTKPQVTKPENNNSNNNNSDDNVGNNSDDNIGNNSENNDSEENNNGNVVVNNDSENNNNGNGNGENNSDITNIDEASIDVPVVEIGEAIVELPASINTFEEAGISVDYDTAKYSEADGLTYAEGSYKEEPVLIGYDESSKEVSEIIVKGPGLRIPGGFTVGDSLQSFRDKFGYWGGDIYLIDNAEYTVSGTDIIESIKIRYKH